MYRNFYLHWAKIFLLAIAGAAVVHPSVAASTVTTYAYARQTKYHPGDALRDPYHNTDFTVRIRTPGGRWQDVYEHAVKVDWNNPQSASLVLFDFTGTVEVAVHKNNGHFSTVAVRPTARGIAPTVVGETVYFTLTRPENLSVEFDGDRLHNLHIFAGDAALNNRRPPLGPDTVIFGPGVHTPPDGADAFTPKSGQTIFLDGGAILTAPFRLVGVHDVTILGHGIVEQPIGNHVIRDSANIRIEGLTTINPLHGTLACQASKNVVLKDIKTFSAGAWGDGINLYSCENVTLEGGFIRTSDDCLTLYAHRGDIYGDTRHVRVNGMTLWADVAHAVFIGLHGDTAKPETIADATFRNLDILDIHEEQPEYQGALAISAGDSNLVRDILFEDIRIEHIKEGKLFNLRVVYNDKYNTSPGRGIENVTLRNIAFTGDGVFDPALIAGYDKKRRVRNVTLENVRIGGRKLEQSDGGGVEVGPFVDGLTVR